MRFKHVCDVVLEGHEAFTVDFQPLPFTYYTDIIYFNERFAIAKVFEDSSRLAVICDTALGFDFVDLFSCLQRVDVINDICEKEGLL